MYSIISGRCLHIELLILAHYDSVVDRDEVDIDFTENTVLVLLQKSHTSAGMFKPDIRLKCRWKHVAA